MSESFINPPDLDPHWLRMLIKPFERKKDPNSFVRKIVITLRMQLIYMTRKPQNKSRDFESTSATEKGGWFFGTNHKSETAVSTAQMNIPSAFCIKHTVQSSLHGPPPSKDVTWILQNSRFLFFIKYRYVRQSRSIIENLFSMYFFFFF